MLTPEIEELMLIEKAQSGDLAAFEKLITHYQSNIRSFLAVRLNQVHESDDLAQEVFIIAFNKLNEFEGNNSFGPWLRGIAHNLLKNYWRKNKEVSIGCHQQLEALININTDLQMQTTQEHDLVESLGICMNKLTDDNKDILHQHYEQGYSIKDLTLAYQSKHSAITMRLHRIREQLKKCIYKQLDLGNV